MTIYGQPPGVTGGAAGGTGREDHGDETMLKFGDRIVWTDRSNKQFTGWYKGVWEGFAEILLDVLQANGQHQTVQRIKVRPDTVTVAPPENPADPDGLWPLSI